MNNTRIAAARRIKDDILTAMEENDRITDRDKVIIRRVLGGETYDAVARDFGISRERVRCICFFAFLYRLKFEV
jgi:DNA-directed RNA polymerase sigma subunit (sigma70/sigma32)